jgi:hypothetical protein
MKGGEKLQTCKFRFFFHFSVLDSPKESTDLARKEPKC